MKMGKKYTASAALVERAKLYDTDEAISLVCQTAKAKFDVISTMLLMGRTPLALRR